MALKLVIAPLAVRDLTDITDFISEDDPQAARRLVLRIERTINLLLNRPFMGPAVMPPLPANLRKVSIAPYIAFYRITDGELQIVRVIHSSRDMNENLFNG